jgi:hypothetical protein
MTHINCTHYSKTHFVNDVVQGVWSKMFHFSWVPDFWDKHHSGKISLFCQHSLVQKFQDCPSNTWSHQIPISLIKTSSTRPPIKKECVPWSTYTDKTNLSLLGMSHAPRTPMAEEHFDLAT